MVECVETGYPTIEGPMASIVITVTVPTDHFPLSSYLADKIPTMRTTRALPGYIFDVV